MKALLAFDWQLPLLRFYAALLDHAHIVELGHDLLLFRTPEHLAAVAALDMGLLRKARRVVSGDLGTALYRNPAAIAGLAATDAAHFATLRQLIGERRIWDFYARDPDYLGLVAELERERLALFGPLLADMSAEAVNAFRRLRIDKATLFLARFQQAFGGDTGEILSDGTFARQMLSPILQSFAELDVEPDIFGETVDLKCAAMNPNLVQWLGRRRGAARTAG